MATVCTPCCSPWTLPHQRFLTLAVTSGPQSGEFDTYYAQGILMQWVWRGAGLYTFIKLCGWLWSKQPQLRTTALDCCDITPSWSFHSFCRYLLDVSWVSDTQVDAQHTEITRQTSSLSLWAHALVGDVERDKQINIPKVSAMSFKRDQSGWSDRGIENYLRQAG